MKITIENTSKIVTLSVGAAHHEIPARIWQGTTDTGIPVQVYVTRIAPEIPPEDARNEEFARELQETAAPRPSVDAIPLRMIL
jgi:hypothetical protein